MKTRRIIIVLLLLMVMTGCSSKINENEATNISNKIIDYIKGDYNTKRLSTKEKQIFKDFLRMHLEHL